MFAGVSRDANTPSSSGFSASSVNHSGKCRNLFLDAGTTSLFLFVFLLSVESRDRFPDAGMLVLSLRVVAGFDEVSIIRCVLEYRCEDRLALELEELVDNPGATNGTHFSVSHWVRLPFSG